MFDTYIINLKHEINNYYNLKVSLENKNYNNIFRFDAIYGKEITNFQPYDKYIMPLFKYCAPFSMIGSALSHHLVLKHIYEQYLNKQNKNQYVLVLEDDAIPHYNSDYIENIMTNLNDSIDMLMLYTFEILDKSKSLSYNEIIIKYPFTIGFSACAYIVNIKSIPKIIDKKLWSYFDAMHFNNPFRINFTLAYYHKNLFETSYVHSHTRITTGNNSILFKLINYICNLFGFEGLEFFLFFKVFRIPYVNYELTLLDIIYIYIIFIIFSTIYILYNKRRHL